MFLDTVATVCGRSRLSDEGCRRQEERAAEHRRRRPERGGPPAAPRRRIRAQYQQTQESNTNARARSFCCSCRAGRDGLPLPKRKVLSPA